MMMGRVLLTEQLELAVLVTAVNRPPVTTQQRNNKSSHVALYVVTLVAQCFVVLTTLLKCHAHSCGSYQTLQKFALTLPV